MRAPIGFLREITIYVNVCREIANKLIRVLITLFNRVLIFYSRGMPIDIPYETNPYVNIYPKTGCKRISIKLNIVYIHNQK